MTTWIKGLALGLVGILLVTGLTYYNDWILQNTFLVGNNLPLSVYGGMILFLVTVNVSLFLVKKKLAFNGREIAIAVALILAVCCIPGSGLMRTLPSSIVMPHHHAKTTTGWKETQVLETVPKQMLVDVQQDEDRVLLEYMQGWGEAEGKQVPWSNWLPSLSFWLPLAFFLWMGLLGVALAVHRQWADHEHLPYPIAIFTKALLPSGNGALSEIFHSRLFWLGGGLVILLYTNNYLVAVAELDWITIPTIFEISELALFFDVRTLGHIPVYFSVIGFAFLLATRVSFSVGIAPVLFKQLTVVLGGVGITLGGGGYFGANPEKFLVFGGYLAMALVIAYTGRAYYLAVLKKAFRLPGPESVEPHAVLGMRLFMVAFVVCVVWIASICLDWQLAVLYTAMLMMMFIVMSRIIAETGLFFMQSYWLPCAVLIGIFGAQALGPQTMLILYLLCMVLAVDPREAFMPFIVNALKIVDTCKVKLSPVAGSVAVAMGVGLIIATVVTITLQYRHGVPFADAWATKSVPTMPFNEAVSYTQRLTGQGTLAASETISGFARFTAISPQSGSLIWAALAGAGLVLLCTFGRLRWTWWPLHPVAFLIWTSYPALWFAWSFLIGWILKVLVIRYGGARVFQKLKPLVFGLIAGELVGLLLPIIINMLWFAGTGTKLTPFKVLPG